ncbi:hypothetical protein BDFB_011079, partial [Asbolus verrucosus]
ILCARECLQAKSFFSLIRTIVRNSTRVSVVKNFYKIAMQAYGSTVHCKLVTTQRILDATLTFRCVQMVKQIITLTLKTVHTI